nr:germinal center kinase 1-like [Ipomoea batatas]GMD84108.1 germinal center kinase 1-like [Ipomoea batatas]GMD87499.1 germinal center kinase 1-like [Ipomoea batatas]GMD92486.1 germinal center kinase 1-like [Ipomoea batatas]
MEEGELYSGMADAAALIEVSGSRFSDLELIGRGSFGDVYKGYDKELNKEVAIKVIDLEESEDEIEDIQKEIAVLQQCRSPYITEYYGSYLQNTKLWIIMEYMAGGSVADLIQPNLPLDEMSIACILRDLLHAIEYLHSEGKIHRDIKGVKISAFGYRSFKWEYFILYLCISEMICLILFFYSGKYSVVEEW